MKKKILSTILAIAMMVSCLALFTGCFGGGPKILDETSWQAIFDDVNFSMYNQKTYRSITVTPKSYIINYVEYGKDLTFKDNHYDYYSVQDDEVIEIDSSSYVDYVSISQPFFNFMHDNFNNFTMSTLDDDLDTQIFVYNGALGEEVEESILQMMKAVCNNQADADAFTYDYHSILVISNYENFRGVFFMDGDYQNTHQGIYESEHLVAHMRSVGDCEEHEQVKALDKKDEMLSTVLKLENMFNPVNDFEGGTVNFKVTGGEGVDYMEFYFNSKGLRFYTPNAVDTPGIDGIYYNDNGAYKYYKMTKEGVWSVQTISESQYNTTISTMYEMYCGGKWLNDDSLEYYVDMDHSKNLWKLEQELTGTANPYSLRYYDIKLNTDGNYNLLSGTWKLEMSLPEIYGGAKITYSYTLTVGEGAFTLPSIQ